MEELIISSVRFLGALPMFVAAACLVFFNWGKLQKSEEYLHTGHGSREMKLFRQKRLQIFWLGDFPLFSGFVKQW